MTLSRPSLNARHSAPSHQAHTSLSQDEPTRPFHIRRRVRRSSQPFNASSSTIVHSPSVGTSDSHGLASSTTATDSGTSEDDSLWNAADFTGRFADRSLEYLDLPASIPYTILSLRTQLLTYLSELESRMHAFYSEHLSSSTAHASPSSPTESQSSIVPAGKGPLAPVFQQLEALREDLRRLMTLITLAPRSLPAAASSAVSARSQFLVQEWGALSNNFALPIGLTDGMRANLARLPSADAVSLKPGLASFQALATFPQLDIDFASLLEPINMQVPKQAYALTAKMQVRLESIQDSIRKMTWKASLTQTGSSKDDAPLAQRLEAKLAGLSSRTRSRASSFALRAGNAVHEAEDRLYHLALELARNGQELIQYEHLPNFFRNNEHILSGYRFIPIRNWKGLLRSTFQIHNETGNIHTHLLGLAAIVPLFWPSKGLDDKTTPMDRLVQTVYLLAAAKCLLLSVSWHVMAGCSDRKWFEAFACVDYTGIAWLVAASIWTIVYNCFYCQPNLALAYSFTTLLVGFAGAILPWQSWFNERQNKHWRIAIFLTMCFTGVAPFSHAAFQHGLAKTFSFISPILSSLAFYIGGLVFYATQFPERWAPGRFDTWGHSHQLWHIGIVLAIVCHYRAALIFHANRLDFSCSVPTDSPATSLTNSNSAANPVSFMRAVLSYSPLSLGWFQSESKGFTTPIDHIFAKVGGMEGVIGLGRADDQVLQWRRLIGKIGNGAVGRGWDALVDWAQNFW